MQRMKIGISIDDAEYLKRFTAFLMNHYQDKLEMHIYSGVDQFLADDMNKLDVIILSDDEDKEFDLKAMNIPVIYLYEQISQVSTTEEGGIYFVEKYQDVNRIIEEVLKHVGDEIREIKENGLIIPKTRFAAVYSLCENEYQLPFSVTLASLLSEKEKVLLVDMQENSGLTQMVNTSCDTDLEEVLIMAENKRYSQNRMNSCIGHMDGFDFVYPIKNSENLCEITADTYVNIMSMVNQNMDYNLVIFNLGSRFNGFFEVLNNCHEIYFMQKKGGLGQWREYEFMEELSSRGYRNLIDRMVRVNVPIITNPVTSCERLIEQWKWNELGDLIRGITPEVRAVG